MYEKYADPIDQASYQEEESKSLKVKQIQQQANKPIVLTGYCLQCDTPVEGKRWCSVDCRDLWQILNERK